MPVEFHIAREARDRYEVDEALFTATGNVVVPNFAAARRLAQRMNEAADRARFPDRVVHAGQINAMGLIDEILHGLVDRYREQVNPNVVRDALEYVVGRCGPGDTDVTLRAFVARFPTVDAWRGRVSPDEWLVGETDGVPNREIALEELLMLWLANVNPAFGRFEDLFDDAPLFETSYDGVVAGVAAFFATQPPADPSGLSLIEMLRAPALAVPDSLAGQLRFIRERWGAQLERFLDRLVVTLDVLTEERADLERRFAGPGGGPEDADRRAGRAWLVEAGWRGDAGALGAPEVEQFSVDLDWMPSLVLMAKSTYVWLDQLSKTYARPIERLDQIPDEELDRLARFGFGGLWLIGLWQRSPASQRIKQLRGNPEAVASAYSLDDYRIADDLGGEAAYENLRDRAWARGVRLASDMVPNHMGLDSRWVVEHPDWFISLSEPPYPAYSFSGPDLSADGRVALRIEDHYFDNTDAAVVFQRVDTASGQTRYLYHGNDGTSMPWNDTAQLDYLRADVREAVIQTILAVARRSPVIRFDAAMTLAKRHIERLWYPEPGHAGGIPSRAEHAMAKEAFEAAMPVEFWREVVDRVAAEVPDTLLLAEAFWLMEGYFVRTLGMHRVYNSAFMNMLRDEQNAQYRSVIRNTLEFDPEVLKRYVNFMNNPDEKTAVEQFGKGDKYFGIATLMATLPGLPMFGHGQLEGYSEKYGMEYRRAYWDEKPDPWLIDRHEREIVPLLHRRSLFAHVDEFLFFDFVGDDGVVNEDVYAYSNRRDGGRALIVYHNRFASTSGRIRESIDYSARVDGAPERWLQRRTLADGLGLRTDDGSFAVLRDRRAGLEYLRSTREIRDDGLRLELGAYDCRVFLEVVEVEDRPSHPYARLASELGGRGVPSVEDAMRSVLLRPIQEPLRRLLEPDALDAWRRLTVRIGPAKGRRVGEVLSADLAHGVAELRRAACGFVGCADLEPDAPDALEARLAALLGRLDSTAVEVDADLIAVIGYGLLSGLPTSLGTGDVRTVREWVDAWGLGDVLAEAFRGAIPEEGAAWRAVDAIKALVFGAPHASRPIDPGAIAHAWVVDEAASRALLVNVHRDVRWFNREAWDTLVGWWALVARAEGVPSADVDATARTLRAGGDLSGYRFDGLEAAVARVPAGPAAPAPRPRRSQRSVDKNPRKRPDPSA